ncbi:MAG: hypothetical protein ACREHD_00775 [Pirellulales bacterium]
MGRTVPDDASGRTALQRGAELTTWAVIYSLLGWLSLTAAVVGGAGEARYYLAAGLTLLPLSIGFWFRWSWARWLGFVVFFVVATWAIWQIAHLRVLLMSIALLLTSLETLWCLWRWPAAVRRSRRPSPSDGETE